MDDLEAREAEAWQDFVRKLAEHLAATWPAMPERLGDRYPAFVEHAVQQAGKHGLTLAPGIARYVNLCFVWGPQFHDKPGFEWALGLLAAPHEREWVTVHQLVRRSLAELDRRPDARIGAATLEAADERVWRAFGGLGRRGALLAPEPPPPLPRQACDLEAAELRLLPDGLPQPYRLHEGEWQRDAAELPAPLRIDTAHPAPAAVHLLSRRAPEGPLARLQVRARPHTVCDVDRHPALRLLGDGRMRLWHGHETRAVSFALQTREQPLPAAGAGTAIAEETVAEIHRLELEVCGLRDEGDPVGGAALQVWVWPAAQWCFELQRTLAPSQAADAREPARAHTRCRVERDGEPQPSAALERGFADGLDAATVAGLKTLLQHWRAVPGLSAGTLEAQLGLLGGRARIAWGWHLARLEERALMRVLGELALQAVEADLQFAGELSLEGTLTRLQLHCRGSAALEQRIERTTPVPTLLESLLPAVGRFRLPFEAEFEPLAIDSGAMLQPAGPCSGAIVGEAGLRPRTTGGSGWEWFAGLRVEAVALPVELADPVLGRERRMLTLLPACTLVEWRLG